ncbi:hypothetical protein LSAT2_028379, partial [Lamellibrachia satsuma]
SRGTRPAGAPGQQAASGLMLTPTWRTNCARFYDTLKHAGVWLVTGECCRCMRGIGASSPVTKQR